MRCKKKVQTDNGRLAQGVNEFLIVGGTIKTVPQLQELVQALYFLLTISSFSVSPAMHVAFFTFAVVAIAVGSFDNAGSSFGTVTMAMPISISVRCFDVQGQEDDEDGQNWQPGLHVGKK